MKQSIRLFSRNLTAAMLFSAVSSLTLLSCIFLQNAENIGKYFIVGGATVFWLGLFFEQFFLWRANNLRRKIEDTHKLGKAHGRPGIISFFQNPVGAVSDILLFVSLICLLIFMKLRIGENAVQFIFITLLVFSFRFHCILNGKNFKYKKALEKRKVLQNEYK